MLESKVVDKLIDNENDEKYTEESKRRKFVHQYDLFFSKMRELLTEEMIKTHGKIYSLNEIWNIKEEKRYIPREE